MPRPSWKSATTTAWIFWLNKLGLKETLHIIVSGYILKVDYDRDSDDVEVWTPIDEK